MMEDIDNSMSTGYQTTLRSSSATPVPSLWSTDRFPRLERRRGRLTRITRGDKHIHMCLCGPNRDNTDLY